MERARYARLITMKAKRGKGRRFKRVFEEQVAPSAKGIEGLRRLYLLRRVGKSDEFAAISLWNSERSAAKYAKSGENKEYSDKLAAVRKGR
jgi:heme-degrading monooxygenase HmoA